MSTMFVDAVRKKKKLRLLLAGPTDAGKTRTAIRFAFSIAAYEIKLAGEKRSPIVCVIDTEHGRASFYKGRSDDGIPYNFKTCELNHFSPDAMIAVIKEAWNLKPDVLVLDSASHEWSGAGGALEMQSRQSLQKGYNSYSAWGVITPKQNQFVEAILTAPFHIVATVRQKMDAVMEPDPANPGKNRIRSIGLQDKQRDDFRYEFDVIGNISQDHELEFVKTPWDEMPRGPFKLAGPNAILPLIDWLNEGAGDIEIKAFPEESSAEVFVSESDKLLAKVREAAIAGQGGNGNGSGQSHADANTAIPADPATVLQISEINIHINTLQLAGQPAGMLAKRGVNKLQELTKAQADEILAVLRPKVVAKKKELDGKIAEQDKAANAAKKSAAAESPTAPQSTESAVTSAPPVQPSKTVAASSPEADSSIDHDRVGTISPHDQTRIIDGCKKLLMDDDDVKRMLAKRITQGGSAVRTIPDLSHNQAQEIIEKLRAAIEKRFPEGGSF